MTPQRKRILATAMVIVLATPAILIALTVLRRTGDQRRAAAPAGETVVFVGAAGWSKADGPCTEVRPEDGCVSEWRHDGGQVARVFAVAVPDRAALDGFVKRLEETVTKNGGVVERIAQGELSVVRFLQAAPGDLATINYALPGRDARALHLVTSVVPFAEQQGADQRLRGLLDHASWSPAR
ncbi:MAG: hypothetical protein HYS27_06295 [Deltaproteobacteria bacterium]|nr:hypothetical protein [Deltaproteobacteria bacterium]